MSGQGIIITGANPMARAMGLFAAIARAAIVLPTLVSASIPLEFSASEVQGLSYIQSAVAVELTRGDGLGLPDLILGGYAGGWCLVQTAPRVFSTPVQCLPDVISVDVTSSFNHGVVDVLVTNNDVRVYRFSDDPRRTAPTLGFTDLTAPAAAAHFADLSNDGHDDIIYVSTCTVCGCLRRSGGHAGGATPRWSPPIMECQRSTGTPCVVCFPSPPPPSRAPTRHGSRRNVPTFLALCGFFDGFAGYGTGVYWYANVGFDDSGLPRFSSAAATIVSAFVVAMATGDMDGTGPRCAAAVCLC